MYSAEATLLNPFEPERLLVVQHPHCPNLKAGMSQVSEAEDAGYAVELMPTEPEYEATRDKFFEQYRPGDLVVVVGGEGTTNRAYHIMQNLPVNERNLLGIGGGNACDYRAMVNTDKRLLQIMKYGKYCTMRALDMQVQDMESHDRPTTYTGLAYIGIGGTAFASEGINRAKRTSNEFTRQTNIQRGIEAVVAWGAVGLHRDFTVIMDEPGAEAFKASDFSAFNGDRVAVYGHPHADIFDPDDFTTLFSRPFGMPGALVDMLRMQRGTSPDVHHSKAVNFLVSAAVGPGAKPLWAHFDGDTARIPPYSFVTAGPAAEPYFTFSTRLAEREAA